MCFCLFGRGAGERLSTDNVPSRQRVFKGHVSKPVYKKQSDLTVYFVSDNVCVKIAKRHCQCTYFSLRDKSSGLQIHRYITRRT